MRKLRLKSGWLRRGAVLLLFVALFVSVTTVLAYTFITIDTNDGTLTDWSDVPVFQYDPADADIAPAEDILETMAVYGDADGDGVEDHLALCAGMEGSNALERQYTAVAATLDCDMNGEIDAADRMVVYIRYGDGSWVGNDAVYVYKGDRDSYQLPGETEQDNHNHGEVLGSEIEWQTPLSMFVFPNDPEGYCTEPPPGRQAGTIPISFTTIEFELVEICYPIIGCFVTDVITNDLDTTASELPPDPTAIDLYAMEVQVPQTVSFLSLSLLFAGLCLLTGVAVLRVQRRHLY